MSWKDYLILAAVGVGCLLVLIIIITVAIKRHSRFKPHFRKFHEAITQGHPQYVYGKSKRNYKSIGLTKSDFTDRHNIPLDANPEPGNNKKAYFLPRPNRISVKARSKRLDGWELKTDRDKKTAKKISRRIPRRRKYPSRKGKKK